MMDKMIQSISIRVIYDQWIIIPHYFIVNEVEPKMI